MCPGSAGPGLPPVVAHGQSLQVLNAVVVMVAVDVVNLRPSGVDTVETLVLEDVLGRASTVQFQVQWLVPPLPLAVLVVEELARLQVHGTVHVHVPPIIRTQGTPEYHPAEGPNVRDDGLQRCGSLPALDTARAV